jgi:hypothetical protein
MAGCSMDLGHHFHSDSNKFKPKKRGGFMPTKPPCWNSSVKALGSPHDALERLENAFEGSLLVVAGDLNTVAAHAEKLRLAVTTEECSVVLDHLTVQITIDQVEEVINLLFPDRFVEP